MASAGTILACIVVFIAGISIGVLISSAPQPAVPDTPVVPADTQIMVSTTPAAAVPTATTTIHTVAETGTSGAAATSAPVSVASAATVIPTPTPTPDPIVGTWKGSKTALFVYSGEATVTFNADHTAYVSGFARGPELEKSIATGFTWNNLGNSKYRGSYGSKSLDFAMSGNTLIMTINPAKLGISDQLNMDITVDLSKT